MAYVRREFPEKSWSVSRSQTLGECARKYYYHYYGSHNGWERDAPELAKTAYRLKQLTNLYLVFGDALHQAAAHALHQVRQGRTQPTIQEMTDFVRHILNDTYRRSKSGRERFWQSPKRNPMLHEMYYAYGPSKQLIDKIKQRLNVCIPALLNSPTFAEASSPQVVEIAKVDQLDSFELYGTKVYAAPDLLYRRADDTWVIVDWKTGAEADEHMDQVNVYALYAQEKLGLPLNRLVVRLEYLLTGDTVEARVSPDKIAQVRRDLEESMREMDALLADPEQNKPKPIEAFPLRDDQRLCRFCNFYALCQEEPNFTTASGQ